MDDRTITTTVAQSYLAALKQSGVNYVFANAGTDFAPIIEGLVRSSEEGKPFPEFLTVPHENVAVAMAHGYYEISQEMAAVMVHVTVGTANALCGIMNAARDNAPMLLAAGRTPLTEIGEPASRNGHIHWGQESFDQGGMVREYVKWDYELRHGQPPETVVERAVDIAMSDPKGPVYLTLPREVLAGPARPVAERPKRPAGTAPAMPTGQGIDQAADMIAAADNVLIIAGSTGRSRAGFAPLQALVEDAAIPVTQAANVNLPYSHPMMMGAPTKKLLEWADLIVVLDSPVPWIPQQAAPRTDCKVIHIGPDPLFSRYPHRGYVCDLALAGNIAQTLPALHEALRARLSANPARTDKRRKAVAEMREELTARRNKRLEEVRNLVPIHPVWTAHCISEVKASNAIVANELGAIFDYLRFEEANCLLGTGTAGGLGRGLGAAIGAKLAAPDRQVIAAIGDGSYMFSVPTAAHFVQRAYNLPTLTIVNNNNEWHAVRNATLSVYPDGRAAKANTMPITELSPSPAFERTIEASEGYGERVEDPAKLQGAIERGLKKVEDGAPALLNLITQAARG